MGDTLRIVALADSLALPRPDKEGQVRVRWEETWPYRLGERLRRAGRDCEVINCGARLRSATDLEIREHVLLKEPSIVIVQIGIVDCAPRVFSRRQHAVLASRFVPWRVREWLIAYRSKRRRTLNARDSLARVYTKPARFRLEMERLRDTVSAHVPKIRVVIVPILVHPSLAKKSPGYLSNAKLYNEILKDVWGDRFVEPEAIVPGDDTDTFGPDGIHLTPTGNDRLAEALASRIC